MIKNDSISKRMVGSLLGVSVEVLVGQVATNTNTY